MFQPAPLSIDPNEVLRYLGGGHAVPPGEKSVAAYRLDGPGGNSDGGRLFPH